MEELDVQIKSRQYVRQRVTKLCTKIAEELPVLTCRQKRVYKDKMKELKSELCIANKEILMIAIKNKEEESIIQKRIDDEEEYESKIENCLGSLEEQNSSIVERDTVTVSDKLKLPQVPLPIFSNAKGESLKKFLNTFEAIIDKHKLNTYEKFIYMRKQLSGGPLKLVESLDVQQQSYEVARDLLMKAFDCELTAKYEIIEKLASLKLCRDTDPYVYVGEMRTILAEVESRNVKLDDILQYFIWHGLNENFQNSLVAITNKTKPSLNEITTNIFEAIERYNKLRTSVRSKTTDSNRIGAGSKTEVNSNAMAVNVKNKEPCCNLCKSDYKDCKHAMKECPVYNTSKKKVQKLKFLKACTKCSFSNHVASNCKFKFKSNCRHCNGLHMSYLCLTSTSPTDKLNNTKYSIPPGNATTNLSIVEAAHSSGADGILLPTVTANLKGKINMEVRGFIDTGCQRTFIDRETAAKLNLPVIESNVELKIHGFNSSKSVITNTVKVTWEINGEDVTMEAICMDHIRTKFCVDGIGRIVKEFKEKGYKLADKEFTAYSTGHVNDIKLIIGTDHGHLLPMQSVLFGNQSMSSYGETPLGVVLIGRISQLLLNIEDLPRAEGNSVSVVTTKDETSTALNEVCSENTSYKLNNSDTPVAQSSALTTSYEYKYHEDCTLNGVNKLSSLSESELERTCIDTLGIVKEGEEGNLTETNSKLIKFVLNNTTRDQSGSLIMPITWNHKNSHLLAGNYKLALSILHSTVQKLRGDETKLKLYDDVFKEQVAQGIIGKISNIEEFLELHPEASFLGHMGVFKLDKATSKCRVVFLSNLCGKTKQHPNAISHNMAILPGPCLNHNITTAITLLRFDKYLLTFDLRKAFLMIKLKPEDQNRLLFLWYNNIEQGDYSVIGYKSLRLPFGLRCSPALLMLALYRILILDTDDNEYLNNLKMHIYNTIYMDNGSFSCNTEKELRDAFLNVSTIFNAYNFDLQQFCTNFTELQDEIDYDQEKTPEEARLFGMTWNRVEDTLCPFKITLNESANTKRLVLQSLNAVYDIYNLYGPLLLRAKLFMQRLQSNSDVSWDTELSESLQREWQNIARQANAAPVAKIDRFVGVRSGIYQLCAFTDASRDAYGTVVYIKNMGNNTVSFLTSKNKLLNRASSKRSIPTLELEGIWLGVQTLNEYFEALCGSTAVVPISITSLELYTDSMVCLHWLQSYAIKFDKLQRLSVVVSNRLKAIDDLCRRQPVNFKHIAGNENVADYMTRPVSHKILAKTSFYSGPAQLSNDDVGETLVTIPNPICKTSEEIPDWEPDSNTEQSTLTAVNCTVASDAVNHLIPLDRFRFSLLVGVTKRVLCFINKLKLAVKQKNADFKVPCLADDVNYHSLATSRIICAEQRLHFADVFAFMTSEASAKRDIPPILHQFNLFKDEYGLLRIKSKFSSKYTEATPILLPKESPLAALIIEDIHSKLGHSGLYPVLREFRKDFHVTHYYSIVRKILRNCITCRKFNARPVKLNQSSYRDFRVSPPEKPYSYVYLDYIGPVEISLAGERRKAWLLIITCLWSRAVNLKICLSANVVDFLKAVQLHVFEYGIFQYCVSDQGSQILAGANSIKAFLSDYETQTYFDSQGIKSVTFQHYAKGNSALGSLVEICVKAVKQLIFKSIRTVVLDFFDFQFLIAKVIHLVNKRPVAFKESLRTWSVDSPLPQAITPEMLLKGYETVTVNILPQIQWDESEDFSDSEQGSKLLGKFEKLRKVRNRLIDIYHREFLCTLINQAIDKKERYKPVPHTALRKGDIVLLVDKNLKRYCYPMGRITEVEVNQLGEVTAAYILKGNSGEIVYRHASSLILLVSEGSEETSRKNEAMNVELKTVANSDLVFTGTRERRTAAEACKKKLKLLAKHDDI